MSIHRQSRQLALLIVFAAGSLFAPPSALAANLVLGGGFENTGNSLVNGSINAPWQLGGKVATITTWNFTGPPSVSTDGDDWAMLMMAGNAVDDSGGFVYQVISVVPNTPYDFQFDAARNGNSGPQVRADVFDGDVSGHADFFTGITLTGDLYAITTPELNAFNANPGYVQYGQTGLMPTTNQITIRFYDLALNSLTRGTLIDNVQLNGLDPQDVSNLVPEPSTLVLSALGLFGLVGVLVRRRHGQRRAD